MPHRPRRPPPRATAHLLYGRHAVTAALANPDRPCRRLLGTAPALARLLNRRPDLAVETVPPDRLARLVGDAPHQGLVLEVGELPPRSLADLDPDPDAPALLLSLDQISDPRNLGAILRSAAAFGVRGVILPARRSAELGGACAKAASGALDMVPIMTAPNLARTLADLKERGFWLVGLESGATAPLEQLDLPQRRVLVLGSEGEGMRRLVAEACDFRASLPMRPAVESLNVAVAAGIALYLLQAGREAASA